MTGIAGNDVIFQFSLLSDMWPSECQQHNKNFPKIMAQLSIRKQVTYSHYLSKQHLLSNILNTYVIFLSCKPEKCNAAKCVRNKFSVSELPL